MSNFSKSLDFALKEWNKSGYVDDYGPEISPQGYGPVRLKEDSLPFIKIALIRKYLNEYGDFPPENKKVYESEAHTFTR